jgi:hypothetical protein
MRDIAGHVIPTEAKGGHSQPAALSSPSLDLKPLADGLPHYQINDDETRIDASIADLRQLTTGGVPAAMAGNILMLRRRRCV